MPKSLHAYLCFALLLSACSHTRYYHGSIQAEDATGNQRNVTIQWKRTEHFLRQSEKGGEPISIRIQCGRRVIPFTEKEDGIFFRNEDQKLVSASDSTTSPLICGEVLKHQFINKIPAGTLSLTISCRPQTSRRNSDPRTIIYLIPRTEPYEFLIEESAKDPEEKLNDLLECTDKELINLSSK